MRRTALETARRTTAQSRLAALTDSELIFRLHLLRQRERRTTLEILLHLIEVERRKLQLAQGYASLFEYCVRRLGYSESGAGRRIKTARCMRDFPEVYELLAARQVSLSTVSMIAGTLTAENKRELLPRICNKSRREVEVILSRYRPGKAIPDRIRPVCIDASREGVRLGPTETPAATRLALGQARMENPALDAAMHDMIMKILQEDSDDDEQRPDSEKWPDPYRRGDGQKPTTSTDGPLAFDANDKSVQQRFKLEFGVGEAFMKKFRYVQALLSVKYPAGLEFEKLFEILIDEYLERHCPEKRAEHRERRRCRSENAAPDRQGPEKKQAPRKARRPEQRSRHIPDAVRDEVYNRDRGHCAFVGREGERCNSTWGLQIDHVRPYAAGGDHSVQNLRLLCARHNRLEAERVYGRGRMESFYRRDPTSGRPFSSSG